MRSRDSDGQVFAAGTFIFSSLALVIAFGALVTAGIAYSRSDDAKHSVAKLAAGGVVPSTTKVTLEEFTIVPHPSVVKAGTVTIDVDNVGTVTHEMVLVRAANPDALPRVTTATPDRAVGDVDEEAIPAADKMGETGDVPPRGHVTKKFDLTPGTYVMFCNIDTQQSDGSVLNHFQHGMSATLIVQ
jgi:hypothetical protein